MKRGRSKILRRDLLSIIPILLLLASNSYSASEYYYLQIGSFRVKENAIEFVEKLKISGVSTVIRREEVSGFGYMHRVYLGPFSSRNEANSMGRELKEGGKLTTSPFVRKMKSFVLSNLDKQPDSRVKESQDLLEKKRKEIGPSEEKPLVQKAIEAPQVKPEPSPAPPTQPEWEVKAEREELQDQQTDKVGTPAPPKDMISRPRDESDEKPVRRGRGRNIPKGNVAIGLQHTYFEIDTELKERKRITSDGTTTSTTDLPIESTDKNEHPTTMHLDMLRARFGLTDSLELFVNMGSAYDELSHLKFVYGGGARLNLFQVMEGNLRGFYIASEGEYLAGKLESEYTSSPNYRWKKETDWNEIVARLEVGISRSPFTIYGGGTYLRYREDTDRHLLNNFPPSTISFLYQDKLEEEDSFGAFGGVVFHLTPNMPLNLEGHIGNQKSVFGSLQYQF